MYLDIFIKLFMLSSMAFGLWQLYLLHTKPDIKSYWWYKGPDVYGWQSEEISQFSEKDPKIWRTVAKEQINGEFIKRRQKCI